MAKNFVSSVNVFNSEKKGQIIFNENQKLKENLEKSKNEVQHLKDMIKQVQASSEHSKIFFKDINLVRNIRSDYEFENIEELANDILKNSQIQAVTLTKDNNLIAGYRRYKAIEFLYNQKLHSGEILVTNLDKTYSEIGKQTFDKLQISENEQRKNLDNFNLSDLFNEYINDGKSQKEIAEIFDKSKSKVSELLSIQKIQTNISVKLKEIQYYGMTLKKFLARNLKPKDRQSLIIGVTPLYKISSVSEKDQVKIFIELFGSKIHSDDLKDLKYTKFVKTKENYIDSVSKKFDKEFERFEKKYTDEKSKQIIDKAKEFKEMMEKELRKLQ